MRKRRRVLSKKNKYIFSAEITTVNVSYYGGNVTVNIESTLNGTNIPYIVVSYDGCVNNVVVNETYITIDNAINNSASYKYGSITLEQSGSNNSIIITIVQDYKQVYIDYKAIILDASYNSTESIYIDVPDEGRMYYYEDHSWFNLECSNGLIKATATSNNNSLNSRKCKTIIYIGGQQFDVAIIQLPGLYESIDNHEYVTIGNKKWAIMNVGASSIGEYGNYYQWGAGSATYTTNDQYYHATYSSEVLPSDRDTATQVMGGGWRMPTINECIGAFTVLNSKEYNLSLYHGNKVGIIYNNDDNNCLLFPTAGNYSPFYDVGTISEIGVSGFTWTASAAITYTRWSCVMWSSNMHSGATNGGSPPNTGHQVRGIHD